MSQPLNNTDKIYHELVDEVLNDGIPKGDRTGTGTVAVVGRMAHFDLTNGRDPRLTTKPIIDMNPEEEMFWFISGNTNIKMLRDKGIGIWNSWLIPGTAKYRPCTVQELEKRLTNKLTPNRGYAAITLYELEQEEAAELGRDARYDVNTAPKTPQIGLWFQPALWAKFEQESHDNQGILRLLALQWVCNDLKISTDYLTEGDIGKGGYGAQWRNWEDTQLVSKADLPSYLQEGYKRLGVVRPVIEPFGVEEIKVAFEKVLREKGFKDVSIGDADPCMLPECGWEAVGDPARGDCAHVMYLNEDALIDAYVTIADIPRFVMYRKIDQLANAINLLKSTPDSRRIIVSAWNPALTWKAALPPCHLYFQFISHEMTLMQRVKIFNDRTMLAQRDHERNNEMSLVSWETLHEESWAQSAAEASPSELEQLHKDLDNRNVKRRNVNCFLLLRSNDLGLGMPFNVSQYAALTHMIAQVVGMEPGELVWAAVDAHVYNDHVAGLTEQLARESIHCIPRIKLDKSVKSIDDFDSSKIQIIDYESQPALVNKMLPSV
jgi:thymidylate synthase